MPATDRVRFEPRVVLTKEEAFTACKVLADAGRIELETRGLDAVDVAGLQLLIALRHSAREAGRAVRLAAPPDGALLRALIGAGFWVGGGVGGEPVVARDRFWLGEV